MCPHTNDFYGALVFYSIFCEFSFIYLIHKPVLYIDSAWKNTFQISHQFFLSRRILIRISSDNINQAFRFFRNPCHLQLFQIFQSLFCKNNFVHHHFTISSDTQSSSGSRAPAIMDAVILGMESRYKVSCIAFQSSSEISTAFPFFPTINVGSWYMLTFSTRL